MNRREAIAMCGIEAVEALKSINCEPTSRAYDHEDGEIEWAAFVEVDYSKLTPEQVDALPIGGCHLFATYYTSAKDQALVEACGGDWGAVDFDVDHYQIA